jgi:hypothetical protein
MLMLKGFSIGEMVKRGWSRFKANWGTWIGVVLIMMLVGMLNSFVSNLAMTGDFNQTIDSYKKFFSAEQAAFYELEKNVLWQSVITVTFLLIELGLTLGVIYMSIRSARGESIHIGYLFSRFQYVFHYLFGTILFSLVILAGLLLLVFPVFIWGAKFSLYSYFIADKGVGPVKSLKMSSQASNGSKWDLTAANLLGGVSCIFSVLLLFFGLFVFIPVYYLAWAYIYLHLTSVPPVAISENTIAEN